MSTATAEKPAKKPAYVNPFAIKLKGGKHETLKVKEIEVSKALQARTSIDHEPGCVVDEGRAEQFAAAMRDGAKFPPIKVMRVTDAPGHKDKTIDVVWDGMHTHRGAEIAKIPEIEAVVWEGTWSQALNAAATIANREHETNGMPLSSKDKVHAVKILAAAYKNSDIPKKDWPSNRQAADLVGCSRQLVNDMDPFERGSGDKREAKNAAKRADRAAEETGKKEFEIVTADGEVLATILSTSGEEAMIEFEMTADPESGVVRVREKVAAAASGTEKPTGFDWAGMESHLGYLVRGTDALGDLFDVKKTPDYVAAWKHLNGFAELLKEFKKTHAKKRSK